MTQLSKEGEIALPLDALLLIMLAMANLWFNPVSSALVVTLVAIYCALSLSFRDDATGLTPRVAERTVFSVKLAIVLMVMLIATVLPTGSNILKRRAEGTATNVTDGLIQTELAVQFLLDGKNPYTENYLNTPLASWKGAEIAWTPTDSPLYHNAYLPFLFIMSIPFYVAGNNLLGWYDQRLLYVLLYLILLFALPLLTRVRRNKLCLLITLGLNFLFVYFMQDGRNDIVILLGLVIVTLLVARNHVGASAVVLGMTMMVKHTAWFFLPFYLLYLAPKKIDAEHVRSFLARLWPLYLVVAVILLPFLLWDAPAFFDDTISYLIGTAASSFPIRGWGFSNLILALGLVPSPYAPFPFGIIELAAGIPTLAILAIRQRRNNSLQQAWFGFAVFSFVVQYLSRFFNDNYMVLIAQAFVIALFMDPLPEQSEYESLATAQTATGPA